MQEKKEMISIPGPENMASGFNDQIQAAYSETIGHRKTQEDALIIAELEPVDLKPAGQGQALTPEQIGHRLWTSYLQLDKALNENQITQGTTAITSVFDGKHIITASVGDSASFAVVYNRKDGLPVSVTRLNKVLDKPDHPREQFRIEKANGKVILNRVNGSLSMSRALGDYTGNLRVSNGKYGSPIIAHSHIDIIALSDLPKYQAGTHIVEIITCCDGFTDGAKASDKQSHEDYLNDSINVSTKLTSERLVQRADRLVARAIYDKSMDNVSVAIIRLKPGTPSMIGVYDGHSGPLASTYVATHIKEVFLNQCKMLQQDYTDQALSVHNNEKEYERDHHLHCSDADFILLSQFDVLDKDTLGLFKSMDAQKDIPSDSKVQLLRKLGKAKLGSPENYRYIMDHPQPFTLLNVIRQLEIYRLLNPRNLRILQNRINPKDLEHITEEWDIRAYADTASNGNVIVWNGHTFHRELRTRFTPVIPGEGGFFETANDIKQKELRLEILHHFKELVNEVGTVEELNQVVKDFKASRTYQKLTPAPGFFGNNNEVNRTLRELEEIIDEKRTIFNLASPAFLPRRDSK